MDTKIEGYAFLTGAFVLAGSSVVAGKVLAGLPVFFAAAGGAAIALLALVPLAAGEAGPREARCARRCPCWRPRPFSAWPSFASSCWRRSRGRAPRRLASRLASRP